MKNLNIILLFVLLLFGFQSTHQAFGQCTNDTWAPVIVYPSQDIIVTFDPCDLDPTADVYFEVTVTDDCDGTLIPSPTNTLVPGAEYTVTVTPLNTSSYTLDYQGNDAFSGVFNPGQYQIIIAAEDASGNLREEDFFVVVNQDVAPQTNLSCIPSLNATLNNECQRLISASMVMDGDFGCTSPSDFQVNIVNDNDPSNGNILDGCGQFIYEVVYVGSLPLLNWEDCEGSINGQVSGSGNNLTLSSQAEVDAFPTACLCPQLLGNIIISGADITNLNSLSGVTLIGGNLIITNNTILTSLAGLNALTTIGGNLYIGENPALVNLTGLEAVTTIGGTLQIGSNTTLTSLTGLDGLSFVGYLNITDNPLLSNCEIQSVCDYLAVPSNNAAISGNAPGCATRQQVEDACNTLVCPPGDITFSTQAEMDAFPATYPECTEIIGSVSISGTDITSLNGLSSISSIGGNLTISFTSLTSLMGLNAITSIGGEFTISNNTALANLSGLGALNSVGNLSIQENLTLISMSGLDHPINIQGSLTIQNNSLLSDCAVQAICDYISTPSISINIGGNNLSCNSPAEVSAACANGCSPALPITISGYNCFSGYTTRLTATYGFGYTYLWNTSETRRSITVPPGTYCVTVRETATGCTGTACITVCKKPTVAISPVYTTTICNGECIPLKAMAGDASSYQWSNSGPASAVWEVCPTSTSTNYTVTVTNDSGCTATKSITIRTNSCDNDSGCDGAWNRAAPGNEVDLTEGIPENAIEERDNNRAKTNTQSDSNGLVHAYPNPASHELILDYSEQADIIESLALYNLTGRKVRDVVVSSTGFTHLDVSMLPPGLYILNINGTMAMRVALAR